MRKILSSFVFIFIFTAYAVFRTHASTTPINAKTIISPTPTSLIITNVNTQTPVSASERHVTLTPTVKKIQPVATPTKKHAPIMHMHRGPYVDGVYTGPLADAYYERIQVRVVIKNGTLTQVSFLPFQVYNGTSQAITGYAMPRLRSEALIVQNANVNNISGATEISNAFHASLTGALRKAA